MITFKEFINEGKFAASLKYDDTVDIFKILKNRCSEFLKSSKEPIYRGFNASGSSPWFISQQSKHERKSKSDAEGNVYTLLMDNLNSWQKFPKRSKSLICTTSESTAQNYGSVYLVIPFDGAKWGVCPDDDIWDSFDKTLYEIFGSTSLEEFNPTLKSLFEKLKKLFPEKLGKYDIKSVMYTTDFKILLDMLKSIDSCLEELQSTKYNKDGDDHITRSQGNITSTIYDRNEVVHGFVKARKKFGNLGNVLAHTLNPDKNGFKIFSNKDIHKVTSIMGGGREIWTDSDCVIINPLAFNKKIIDPILKKEAEKIVDSKNENLSKNERREEIVNAYEDLVEKFELWDDGVGVYNFIRLRILK